MEDKYDRCPSSQIDTRTGHGHPEENVELWGQCGQIVKRMHETVGERFGYPPPGQQFSIWSQVISDRLARIAGSMLACQLETTTFGAISQFSRDNVPLLDEIDTPRLLHGDLWTFNLIVRRDQDRPTIVGVLDVDRAWWGDPVADWIMFLLLIRQDDPQWQQRLRAFHDGYGAPEASEAALLRQKIYQAMHIGLAAVWCSRNGDEQSVARAYRDLHEIAQSLGLSSS